MKWYSRGIAAVDEDILVVNGSQQGIDLICKALVGKNTVVLAEDPSYSVALHCFQRAGVRVVDRTAAGGRAGYGRDSCRG